MPSTHTHTAYNRGASAIGTILFLVVVIGGVVWYAQENTTEPPISTVLSAHESVESFGYAGTTTVDLRMSPQDQTRQQERATVLDRLAASSSLITGTSTDTKLTATANGHVQYATSTSFAGSLRIYKTGANKSDIFTADWRKTAADQFVRIRKLPETLGTSPASLAGQWYQLDSTNQQRTDLLADAGVSTTTLAVSRVLSATSSMKLADLLFASGVLTVENTTKTRLRNGRPAYQFNFSLNPQKVSDFRNQLSTLGQAGALSTSSLDNLPADLKKLQSRLQTARIWSGRNTKRLRRLLVVVGPSESSGSPARLTAGTSTIDIRFDDYNQPVSVSAPTQSLPLPGNASRLPLDR